MANEEPEYERRSVERLIFFSDAVVAIAITLLAIDLPVPKGASSSQFWSSVRENQGSYVAFLVSFVTIAAAWSHHREVFKYVRRSDARLRNLNLVWLLMIILIPFATKLLTVYDHSELGPHALGWGFYALVYTVAAAALFAIVRHLVSHGLETDARPRTVADSQWQDYGTILGFGLSIPVFFATPDAWVLWFAVPLLVNRLERFRRGRAASSDEA